MSIELKHLRYAEVAERCGSFRKAADMLTLKQSNLSRRVRHLEEQLGIALFERTNGDVKATSAGRDFVNDVRRILNELQIIVDGAKAALADPTRRAIFERLCREGEKTVGALTARAGVSQPVVSNILES